MGMGYTHPEHGEMEWYDPDIRVDATGWRCLTCGVVAPEDEADDVFDEHDCEQYEKLQKGITGSI